MKAGEYIKKLRTEHGYSQEQLGKMIGVQRAAVQKWESGQVQNLKKETIKALCKILDVSPDAFFQNEQRGVNEMAEFRKRLKEAMSVRNISQAELCEITKIPKSAMSQYVSGSFKPKWERTYLLAKTLNVNEMWLIGCADVPMEKQTITPRVGTVNFGEKLKRARSAKQLTQNNLAELIGVKNTTISNWENGLNKPDIDTLGLICKALDVNATYFIENKESKFTLTEKEFIIKYRVLDIYGKKAVDSIFNIEYTRCVEKEIGTTAEV